MKTRNTFLSLAAVVGMTISAQAQTYIGHTVNQPPLLVADAGAGSTFCAGDNVTLGGSPSAVGGTATYTYSWTPGTGLSSQFVANPVATPVATGTYTLSVIDFNGCSATDSVVLNLVVPVAQFSYTSSGLAVICTDLSQPANTWNWDFGDGITSTLQNPTHTYQAPGGTFIICLTINGGTNCEATVCDTVVVTGVGVANAIPGASVRAYPNPVTGNEMAFQVTGAGLSGSIDIRLYDVQGREVLQYSGSASQSEHRLSRRALAAGTYGYRVSTGEGILGSGKVILR